MSNAAASANVGLPTVVMLACYFYAAILVKLEIRSL